MQPGVERGRLDRIPAERAEPLTQPWAERPRLHRHVAVWLFRGLTSRPAVAARLIPWACVGPPTTTTTAPVQRPGQASATGAP